nr:hypothetical protein BaRGS_035132 [Batillaria attramentaria]
MLLTQAEEDRRRRRKQQNKIAARRFRKNKKLKESILVEDIAMLEGKNSGLRDKITELQQIKESLIHHLTHHLIVCPYYPELPTLAVPTPTASPTPSPSTTAFQATLL